MRILPRRRLLLPWLDIVITGPDFSLLDLSLGSHAARKSKIEGTVEIRTIIGAKSSPDKSVLPLPLLRKMTWLRGVN